MRFNSKDYKEKPKVTLPAAPSSLGALGFAAEACLAALELHPLPRQLSLHPRVPPLARPPGPTVERQGSSPLWPVLHPHLRGKDSGEQPGSLWFTENPPTPPDWSSPWLQLHGHDCGVNFKS